MSSTSKAWAVATSIAAVEALKDQGFCRWNYTIRSLHQHGKNQVMSMSQAQKLSSPTSTVVSTKQNPPYHLLHQNIASDILQSLRTNPTSKSFQLVVQFYRTEKIKMSSASKAWLVAAAIGGVEALKDQGFCRWNYTLRSLHQHAKNHVRSVSQAKNLSSSSSAMISNKVKEEKAKQSEESLRKVMYLSCWGPY
ncbi:unnamed protein product [Dovyalis caffra]|uniref:Wound-responsive family protein n=1 Tax=Dovyalis caffra TaxID=77055 RepID=A0AAV1SFV9_9ROSI|nr:unnamed protein product [Dovyalis caffra]